MKNGIKGIRVLALATVVVFVFALFGARLLSLQIVDGQTYYNIAEKKSIRTVKIPAARGEIVDRYGRPLVVNTMAFNIIFDYAFIKKGTENKMILDLCEILTDVGTQWIDTLPLSKDDKPQFLPGRENDIERLKKKLKLQTYATVDNVVEHLYTKYELLKYTPKQQRIIAGVRYEMESREFSLVNQYTFAEKISVETVTKIKELSDDLPGVDISENAIRSYVDGTIAPHILGMIGPIYDYEYEALKKKGYDLSDKIGKNGIEKAFESELKGTPGVRQIEQDSKGNVISVVDKIKPIPGNTVVLTIDKNLQLIAQQSLEKQIKYLQTSAVAGKGREADTGATVTIEVNTGEILACATYPSYDVSTYQNDYSSLITNPLKPLFNRALNGTYAPGSCYKPSVGIAALSEGIINETSTVNCTRTYNFFKDFKPTCLGHHGNINVFGGILVSCNIFFYDVGRRLGIEKIQKYSKQFGLGQPTGVEIPESKGILAGPDYRKLIDKPWYPGDVVQASIGQSDNSFNAIQLANYFGTISNGGTRYEAHLVKSVKSYNLDKTIYEKTPKIAQKVTAPASAFETLRKALRDVAMKPGGTAYGTFKNYAIEVGAKTGTPEVTNGITPTSTFITFAPVIKPQIAVSVIIEKGWHGYTGAPVARDIYNAYFFTNKEQAKLTADGELLP